MDTSRKPIAEAASRIVLRVNGQPRELELDPRTSLLDALREHLHLTGTKKGCDHGQCGACTILSNGRRINSCLTRANETDTRNRDPEQWPALMKSGNHKRDGSADGMSNKNHTRKVTTVRLPEVLNSLAQNLRIQRECGLCRR